MNNINEKSICQDYPINLNNNNNNEIIIHNWKSLFKEKLIHYHKLQVFNSNKTNKSSNHYQLCPYVGCITITRTDIQYKKHLLSHI
jgi:hypothetical protein